MLSHATLAANQIPTAPDTPLRIAVASNFSATFRQLENAFEKTTPYRIDVSFASSGQLFAQIKHGAPFDAFFSADHVRPEALVAEGLINSAEKRTYACGQLVLASRELPQEDLDEAIRPAKLRSLLESSKIRVALANPRFAPYGVAAKKIIDTLNLSQQADQRQLTAQNVNQAFQYVYHGNADLGFVALAQAKRHRDVINFSPFPASIHSPIKQDWGVITASSNKPGIAAFIRFMDYPSTHHLIQNAGYLPVESCSG